LNDFLLANSAAARANERAVPLSEWLLVRRVVVLPTRNSRKAKIAAEIKVKNVSGNEDTVVAFVVTVLT